MTPGSGEPRDGKDALRPLSRPRLYEELVGRLLAHVSGAGLSPGDRFPPERELAQRLGVSRASVRQAIVALEVQGIVDVRHGDGIYLRRVKTPEPLDRLLDRRRRLPEILEAREALEVKIAELAAVRGTEQDLASIDVAIEAMANDIAGGGIGADADRDFHAALVRAAKNPILAQLMEGLAESVHETRMESLSESGRPPKSLAAHRRIAAAVRRHDAKGAARAMRDHIKVVADVRLLHWQPEQRG